MGKTICPQRNLFAATVALAAATAPEALADPIGVLGGPTQLPTSGLVINLPVVEGQPYKLSGSWALDAAGEIFDTRDVIDEFDPVSGTLTAGNWIMVGYFSAGGCENVLAQFKYASPVIFTDTLWGVEWSVLNGVFEFQNDLGRRPAAALCRENGSGRALLLQRFLVDQPETLSQAALMADVRASEVLASAWFSYSANRFGNIQPTRRPEVNTRGQGTAARTLQLPKSALAVDLPDDGFLWLIAPPADTQTDTLNRLLPTLPEVSVEVMPVDGYTCDDVIASFDDPAMRDVTPTGLPDGWRASPGLMVDGEVELIACHATGDGALLAGVFPGTDDRDVSAFAPLLGALAAAAEAR